MLPILYKKVGNNTRYYKIRHTTNVVKISSGIIGGKNIKRQIKYKNPEKSAITLWNNKLRQGYVDNIKDINKIKIIPMTPYNYKDMINQIKYPIYIQPKIDGNRALIKKQNGIIKIFSSKLNEYNNSSIDHIKKEIERLNISDNIYIDGELYLENYKINKLRSILSKKKIDSSEKIFSKKIKYIIFDIINLNELSEPYYKRLSFIKNILKHNKKDIISVIQTNIAKNSTDVNKYFENYVEKGYEGIILRNKNGIYKFGKSKDVLKSKNVSQNNFIIVGYKEGQGKNKNTVIWKVKCLKSENTFYVKPIGNKNARENYYKYAEKYIGKKILVKYFDINSNGCVTRNPIAINMCI